MGHGGHPFPVTALSVLLLVPMLGIADYATVVEAGFGNPIITFFIGVLLLASGFTRSGLGTRLVLYMLRTVGTRTDRVLLGFLAVGALLSMWLNDLAVAALLLPLGVGVLEDAHLKRLESNFGRALMIACAFGPLIGGVATPAGTGANPVAMTYLRDLAGIDISFLRWMAFGVPAAVLMVPCAWYVLLWVFPPEIARLPVTPEDIEQKLQKLGPFTTVERKTLAIFGVTILLWLTTPLLADVTGGAVNPSLHAVALAGGLALFPPGIRVMSWKTAQRDVEWGGILLIVAGISLGLMVYETGAARVGRVGDAGPVRVRPRPVAAIRDRAGGRVASSAVCQQHGDGHDRHADPDRVGTGHRRRCLDDRGTRGVHLVVGVHPGDGEPSQRRAIQWRLFLDPRHGEGRCLDDVGGRRVREHRHSWRRTDRRDAVAQ